VRRCGGRAYPVAMVVHGIDTRATTAARVARSIVRDWMPFIALLIAYNMLRGTAGALFGVHYSTQIEFDRFLLLGNNGTVWLQSKLWHGSITWYDVACWAVYTDRERFRRYTSAVLLVSFAAVVTYAVFPAAPPWMASRQGLIGPVTRILPLVAHRFGLDSTGSLISLGYRDANNVAAVPSLHAAYSLLIATVLWPRERRWLRPLVALYPIAMAFSLVYSGEHYLFDILLGWGYASAGVVTVRVLHQRRAGIRPEPLGARLPA